MVDFPKPLNAVLLTEVVEGADAAVLIPEQNKIIIIKAHAMELVQTIWMYDIVVVVVVESWKYS